MEITERELIDALQASSNENTSEAKTKKELVEITGKSDYWVYNRLRALKDAGRLGVIRIMRETVAGSQTPVPAYYLKDRG